MYNLQLYEGTIAYSNNTFTAYCYSTDKWSAKQYFSKLYKGAIFITVKEVTDYGNRS